jgi:hypothetical protein
MLETIIEISKSSNSKYFMSTANIKSLVFLRCLIVISICQYTGAFPTHDVKVGDECNYDAYYSLNNKINLDQTNASEKYLKALNSAFVQNSITLKYSDLIPKLCIIVTKDNIIDPYQYDCRKDGKCECGYSISKYDPMIADMKKNLVKTPKPGEVKNYVVVEGLNRLLVWDSSVNECRSGGNGHCTPEKYANKRTETCHLSESTILKCHQNFTCKEIEREKLKVPKDCDSSNEEGHNGHITEFYGKCVDERNKKPPERGDGSVVDLRGTGVVISWSFLFCMMMNLYVNNVP